ncbi:MAG: DUF3422 family protein [Litorivicinaceae bacterium]
MSEFDPHRVRLGANKELHARPFPELPAAVRLVHLCVRSSPKTWPTVRGWIQRRITDLPDEFSGRWVRDAMDGWCRVELHTEFVAITLVVPDGLQFSEVADAQWLGQVPSDIFVLARLTSEVGQAAFDPQFEAVSEFLDGSVLAASNFSPDTAGFSNWQVRFVDDPGPEASGRLLQLILEIETYRTLAVVGIDKVRQAHPVLQSVATALPKSIAKALDHAQMLQMLETLTAEASRLHEIWEELAWRIGANQAYHNLVFQRLADLADRPSGGAVSLSQFLRRRLTPAIATMETVMRRRDELARQVEDRADLLRTQLQLNLQSQTRDLLASLERSAVTQIRLQTAVEGLSTVAIAYYALNLLTPMIEPWVPHDQLAWVKAGLAPVVVGSVWWVLSRIRNRVSQ